jgi:arginase
LSNNVAGAPTLIGVPYDASSSYLRGTAAAPPEIRAALWCEAGNSFSELGVDIRPLLRDAGDLVLANGPDDRATIEAGITDLVWSGARPIVLGGDHSITYPVVRGLHAASTEQFCILHVDAHADLYDVFEGDRFSHACPFARIMDEQLVTSLTQVGIRTLTTHLREQIAKFDVTVIEMRDWVLGARPAVTMPVYISIDLDGLDPAFAPGVSHPEPGGLTTRDVIALLHSIEAPIVGADIVELNPARDPAALTATVAAKLIKELVAVMTR